MGHRLLLVLGRGMDILLYDAQGAVPRQACEIHASLRHTSGKGMATSLMKFPWIAPVASLRT